MYKKVAIIFWIHVTMLYGSSEYLYKIRGDDGCYYDGFFKGVNPRDAYRAFLIHRLNTFVITLKQQSRPRDVAMDDSVGPDEQDLSDNPMRALSLNEAQLSDVDPDGSGYNDCVGLSCHATCVFRGSERLGYYAISTSPRVNFESLVPIAMVLNHFRAAANTESFDLCFINDDGMMMQNSEITVTMNRERQCLVFSSKSSKNRDRSFTLLSPEELHKAIILNLAWCKRFLK